MKIRPIRIATAVVFAVALSLLFPNYAPGAPDDNLAEKARDLENQIEVNGTKASALDEQANVIQIQLDAAQAQTKHLRSVIKERAASIYKVAGARGPLDAINAKDANDVMARTKYTDAATKYDDSLLHRISRTRPRREKGPAPQH
ncbi:MAG: hypothetical protein M3046_02005 [Actinomycetota bacterium]|nr:hypothetical protein [Actinomycetota bacterium]